VQADKAIFGAKDYQQLQVIKQFVKDLCVPIEILSHPIVREVNGLAMSSRNAYLSEAQRGQAALIQKTLQGIKQQLQSGARNYQQLEEDAVQLLDAQGFVSDYISIRCPDLSEPEESSCDWVVLAAIKLGSTRLLDNIEVSL
jgi:pantoate--beta-alanine ligase